MQEVLLSSQIISTDQYGQEAAKRIRKMSLENHNASSNASFWLQKNIKNFKPVESVLTNKFLKENNVQMTPGLLVYVQ